MKLVIADEGDLSNKTQEIIENEEAKLPPEKILRKRKSKKICRRTISIIIVIGIVATILNSFIVNYNRRNLPEILVIHEEDGSVRLNFAGFNVFSNAGYPFFSDYEDSATILPLSDGNYLVGLIFF